MCLHKCSFTHLRAFEDFNQAMYVGAGNMNLDELVPRRKQWLVAGSGGFSEDKIEHSVANPTRASDDDRSHGWVRVWDVPEERCVECRVKFLQSLFVSRRRSRFAGHGNIYPLPNDGHVLRKQAEGSSTYEDMCQCSLAGLQQVPTFAADNGTDLGPSSRHT
jgi:hypothetical protein